MSTKRKASVTSEIVIGQAASKLTKAVAELTSATSEIAGLVEKSETLSLEIAGKEDKIVELDTQFAEKKRQLEVSLDLDMKSKTQTVVLEYLRQNNQVAVASNAVSTLEAQVEDLQTKFEQNVRAEVAKAVGSLKATHESEIKLLNAEYKAKEAENLSKIGTLTEKNDFLQKQVDQLFKQIDLERNAGVQRAQAGSIGSINVGTGNGK
jgi:chorismate mutase